MSPMNAKHPSISASNAQLKLTNLHLYDRSSQIDTLREAYDRSSESCQVVWVSGHAGVGKSALVEHAFRDEEVFCCGKFERLRTSQEPYDALVSLLSRLCCILAAGYPAVKISADHAAIIAQLMPDIYEVTHCERGASASYNAIYKPEWGFEKLKLAIRAFVVGVCGVLSTVSSTPFIMFVDDLQWVDADSLEIIKTLLSDNGVVGLLFVGSYRDNELDDLSALANCINVIEGNSVNPGDTFTKIHLKNLGKESIDRLIADLTQMPTALVHSLSDLIYSKTSGNCFFTLRVLRHIFADNCLEYSEVSNQWEWNAEKIRVEVDVSDNVVDFMAQKLQALPHVAKDALQVSACLGSRVDVELLADLLPIFQPAVDMLSLLKILQDCSLEYLVEFNSDQSRFRFSHDRIQAAAYDLIPLGKRRQNRHLKIGRHLQQRFAEKIVNEKGDQAWQFIVGVDQLNRGKELLLDEEERVEVARLNSLAAKEVMKMSAFKMAAQFLETGIELLGLHRWNTQYELSLEMSNLLVSVLFSNGQLSDTLELIEYIYCRARHQEDLYDVKRIHVEVLACLNQLPECLDMGVGILRELGHPKIPRKPGLRHIIPAMIGVQKALKGQSDEDLLALPMCNDPKQLAIMRNLGFLSPMAFFANEEELIPILTCRMMKISLRHGVSKSTPYAFASYGFALTVTGEFAEAYRFAMLALRLMERFHEDARTLVMVHGLLSHLKRPIVDSNDFTLKAYSVAFSQGDLPFAGQACAMHCISRWVAGLRLENIVTDVFSFCDQLLAYDQVLMWNLLVCIQRSLLELVDRPSDMSRLIIGAVLDDEAYEKHLQAANADMVVFFFWMQTSWCRFYLGDLESALFYAKKCWRSKGLKGAFVYSVPYFFFNAMIALDSWKSTNKMSHWRVFCKNHRELKKWPKRGNPNTSHLVALLDAELLVVQKSSKPGVIRGAYDKSIALASRGGFVHDAALASERVGAYFLEREDTFWSNHYLTNAQNRYKDWGSVAKVNQLGQHESIDMIDMSSETRRRGSVVKGRSQALTISLTQKARDVPLISMDNVMASPKRSGRLMFPSAG